MLELKKENSCVLALITDAQLHKTLTKVHSKIMWAGYQKDRFLFLCKFMQILCKLKFYQQISVSIYQRNRLMQKSVISSQRWLFLSKNLQSTLFLNGL